MFEFSLRRTYELLLEQLKQARRTRGVHVKVFTFCHPDSHRLALTGIVHLYGWGLLRVSIHVRKDQDLRRG